MKDFTFYNPTEIIFGKGKIEELGKQIKKYASKVLLVYGKGSIKKNGVYDAVVAQLKEHEIEFIELSGIDPNPRLSTVVKGAELCRENDLGFVLAVGGGSVIDCAKGIAAVTLYDGDPWDFWAWKARVKEALPIGSVLTLAATGSEMNSGGVVTNKETEEKHGMGGRPLFPKFSILDPTYTFTVPKGQTAAGVADIMAHVFEFYFTSLNTAFLQDSIAEAVLKTCIKYGPIAYNQPDDYEARANLMWASSVALSGVVSNGKTFDGFNHMVEHGISAIYDLTHGVGLAILTPHWMEYVLDEDTLDKFVTYAQNVWGAEGKDDWETAKLGIQKTADFYKSIGLPDQLSEVEIGDDRFEDIIEKSVLRETIGDFKKLSKEDVMNILVKAK